MVMAMLCTAAEGNARHRPRASLHDQIAVRGVEGDVDGLPSRPAGDGQHAAAQSGGDGRNGARLQLFQLQPHDPRPAAEGRAGAEEVEQAHRTSFRGVGEDEDRAHGRALSDEPGPNDCPLQSARSARILDPDSEKVHGFSDGPARRPPAGRGRNNRKILPHAHERHESPADIEAERKKRVRRGGSLLFQRRTSPPRLPPGRRPHLNAFVAVPAKRMRSFP